MGKSRAARVRRRSAQLARRLSLLAAIAVSYNLAFTALASASRGQIAIIEDEPAVMTDPAGTLGTFRALGASTVRVIFHWSLISPQPTARHIPAGFDPSDPNAYPASGWVAYDQIVRDATAMGMAVDFTLAGGAPRWAEGSGIPPQGADLYYAWKPNAKLYGQFVHAVGERYSGHFTPAGATAPLPAVRFWALWNEPNFGQDLAPQAIDGSRVSVAPMMYRALTGAGWAGLQRTGHGNDTILIGELAAQGQAGPVNRKHPEGLPGDYAQTKPLQFIRTLYCLGPGYKQLRGGYATKRGCPTGARGSRRFRAGNPVLFHATGVGDHPYLGDRPPSGGRWDPDFATFPVLGHLERALDRVNRVYGSDKRYPIYSDEYGDITRPPQIGPYVSPTTAAYYLNWSEYLSWRNPRVASYAQYLLDDPMPHGNRAGFATGLLTDKGMPKATYYAYRLPVYLPKTQLRRGRAAVVWGDARPAHFAELDGGQVPTVAIQLQRHGSGPFMTITTVDVTNPGGYFDVRVKFPVSGNVRLAYSYPQFDPLLPPGIAGTTVESRSVRIQVR
jgi:hypothetical protein